MLTTSQPAAPEPPARTFVLRPHRSLSPAGFLTLMLAVGLTSFAAGLVFFAMGAWPVAGFLGLDVVLVYLAFQLSYRAARQSETLRLVDHELEVARTSPGGRTRMWRLSTAWLRVDLAELAGGVSRLELAAGRQRLEVGAFLSDPERRDLATALRRALAEERGRRI